MAGKIILPKTLALIAKKIILPVTLTAIVRDERINPAMVKPLSGIESFIEAHVPYVEQAVIADTGSVDGTREILEEAQFKHPNLKVIDIPFEGYAQARNEVLKYVETQRALVLDADELLTHEVPQNDWRVLKEILKSYKPVQGKPYTAFHFSFTDVSPNGEPKPGSGHAFRLFDVPRDTSKRNLFSGTLWETFRDGEFNLIDIPSSTLTIKHFLPSVNALMDKKSNWYNKFDSYLLEVPKISPSQAKKSSGWKAPNPQRTNYF